MAPARILLYANVDAAEAGGVQGVVRSLRSYLAGRGHRVTTGWTERSGSLAADTDGWAQAFHIRRDAPRWLHRPTFARLALRLMRERPQVVNIHFASPSARYFLALGPRLGFRVAVTCHGSDILRPLPHDVAHLAPIITDADAVTVVSEEIAARLAAQGIAPRRPPVVIANGVDTGFWQPPATRPETGETPTLVGVGRLEPVKGFDILIEAAALLTARGTQVRLVIIGEGSQGPALSALAAQRGIVAQMNFAGRLPPEAIRAHLHAACAFVLPSRSEGMPLALMEAMATGTPVIAADVGGVARAAGGAAMLVPPENPEALAAAIAALIGDEPARGPRGEAARARAKDFSIASAHAAYEALLTGLAGSARA